MTIYPVVASLHMVYAMKLSVILTLYDMAREVTRTLRSLSRSNQHGAKDLAYDILLFDNGSPVLLAIG